MMTADGQPAKKVVVELHFFSAVRGKTSWKCLL